MISSVRLYNSVNQRAKSGTTGYDSIDEYNAKIADTQTELFELLISFYSMNYRIQEALAPFIKSVSNVAITSAGLTRPTGYVHILAFDIEGLPSKPINVNQVSIMKRNKVRTPSVSKGTVYHYLVDEKIKCLPEQDLTVSGVFARQPAASLVTETSDGDDFVTVSSVSDLEWPEMVYNLMLYLMLQKLGIEMKENLLIEYANLGISRETLITRQ